MSPRPRRLTFAVGTSLLTASLTLGALGCDEPKGDTGSDKSPEPEKNVNVAADPEPEPLHVNEGPEPAPPAEIEGKVNTGPEPEPPKHEPSVNVVTPAPPEAAEPEKHVNTRPSDK